VAGGGDISLRKIKYVASGHENVVAEDALGLCAGRRAPAQLGMIDINASLSKVTSIAEAAGAKHGERLGECSPFPKRRDGVNATSEWDSTCLGARAGLRRQIRTHAIWGGSP
jgi:hypothetical protein